MKNHKKQPSKNIPRVPRDKIDRSRIRHIPIFSGIKQDEKT